MCTYNGEYVTSYAVTVKANNHDECLQTYNRIKKLAQIWSVMNIRIYESKSARKGDVLRREIQIVHTAYAHNTIIFKEALNVIVDDINLYHPNVTATIHREESTRKDARLNLIQQTT